MSISSRSRISGKSATPSSILKKNYKRKFDRNTVSTPSKVRFTLPQTKKVQNILQDYAKRNLAKDYENLVCLIRDAELMDEDISSLLKEANSCISMLDHRMQLFVEAILFVKWNDRSKTVVDEYHTFIVNLLSAHVYHAKIVLEKLVKLFYPSDGDPEWPDGAISEIECMKFANVHVLLKTLLKVVPMCQNLLWQSIQIQFPYHTKSTHRHECYLHNILFLLEYVPAIRSDALYLIFSKLVVMDVNAPKEVIEKEDEMEDEVFAMDDDAKSMISSASSIHLVAHTLDVCLDKVFDYFITECHDVDSGNLDWEKTKYLYHDMLTVFDKVILPTHNTHHVQFIMFVMCNFKSTIAEAFLNYLWKKVCNPNIAPVLRQAAVAYIASLVARGNFIKEPMMKGTLQQMAEWIHSYISVQESLSTINTDVRVHSVFYSVCQAVFYIVSFRHSDLVRRKSNIVFLESLNMAKMVTCRLNPLRVCQPAVVQNFAAITRKYQLAYCYSVIEHNSRNIMPTIYQDEKGSVVVSDNVLNTYYPFDPFILERSSDKIKSAYRELKQHEDIDKMDFREAGEVDDFLDNNHELCTTPTPKSYRDFSYGSSPGFKFKG